LVEYCAVLCYILGPICTLVKILGWRSCIETLQEIVEPFVLSLSEILGAQVLWKDSNPVSDREFSDQACRHSCKFCLEVKSNRLRLTRCMQEDGRFEISQSVHKRMKTSTGFKGYFRDCHGGVVDYIYPVSNKFRYLGAFFLGPWKREVSVPPYPDTREAFEDLGLLPPNLAEKIDRLLAPIAKLIALHKTGEHLDQPISTNSSRITPGLEFIHAQFGERLLAHQVAMVCNLSVSRFLHLCKSETGVSFSKYVLDVRLDRAKELLKANEYTIEQIARETGFPTRTYFSRMFRQMTGVSPREYRQKQIKIGKFP
jgi:AraC-like DNA-binding protein